RNIGDTSGIDLSSLGQALSGAEPVRLSTIAAFETKLGVHNLITPCYGLAEATLAVAIWPRKTPLSQDSTGRLVSVGRPCTGVSVQVADEAGPGAAGGAGVSGGHSPAGQQGD